jgi:rhamnogalacturonyl hydrolase YesR
MTEMTSVGTDFMDKESIKKWVKVGRDDNTGLWYYENSRGIRSQAIFANRKKAWAKGNDYIDMIYPKRSKKRGKRLK